MELWMKYGSRKYSDDSMQRLANPATRLFAPDSVAKSPSNLRRASTSPSETLASHTRLKRRKAASFERPREADSQMSGDDDPGGRSTLQKPSRQARVVSLLDQVKQNLNKSASKSLPLLAASSAIELEDDMPPSSPLLAGRPQHADKLTKPGSISASVRIAEDSDSEDYGDFDEADIDMEFIAQVEESQRAASATQTHEARSPFRPPQSPTSTDPPPVPDEPSEFDEPDYEDVFGSIELERLVAQYDQPCKDVGDGPQLERKRASSGSKN
jgi:hypothetical protein